MRLFLTTLLAGAALCASAQAAVPPVFPPPIVIIPTVSPVIMPPSIIMIEQNVHKTWIPGTTLVARADMRPITDDDRQGLDQLSTGCRKNISNTRNVRDWLELMDVCVRMSFDDAQAVGKLKGLYLRHDDQVVITVSEPCCLEKPKPKK